MNTAEQEQRLALVIQKPNGEPNPNMGDESMALLKAGGISFTFQARVDDTSTNIPGLDVIRMRNVDLTRMMRVIYGQNWQLPNPPYPV